VEQVTSGALVTAAAYRYLLATKRFTPELKKRLRKYLLAGVAKLVSTQNGDGGWGWFRGDATDPFFTAYVLNFLTSASEFGIMVSPKSIKRAVNCLTKCLQAKSTSDFVCRDGTPYEAFCAYLFGYIANAAAASKDSTLLKAADSLRGVVEEYLRRGEDALALASGLLGLARLGGGREELLCAARRLARLASNAVWTPLHISPRGGAQETTALALKALITASPSLFSDQIKEGLRRLQKWVGGGCWQNTTAAAAAIETIALSRNIPVFTPGTVRVLVNGRQVSTVKMTKEDGQTEALKLRLIDATPFLLDGKNEIVVEAPGSPAVSVRLERWGKNPRRNISITRRYSKNIATIADHISVELTIRTKQPLQWTVLEEPIPANCIPDDASLQFLKERGQIADYAVMGGKLFLYLRRVDGLLKLSYSLLAQRSGVVTQAAPRLTDMYDDDHYVLGAPTKLTISR